MIKRRKNIRRQGAVKQTPKRKFSKSWIVILILLILVGVGYWKRDFIINIFRKKTVITPPEVNTITKYITTKGEDFPLKNGSSGKLVEQVQQFYNTAPSQVIKNRTPLVVDGKWGNAMDAAFKKSGLPLVITKKIFDTVFRLK